MRPIIIAIDGYSSCGKSTLAKALAQKLSFAYMDTGAMYRAVTLFFMNLKVDPKALKNEELDAQLNQIDISFQYNLESNRSDTYLNGQNVEAIIRGKEVSQRVSQVSQIPLIRKQMIHLQRKVGKTKSIVIDGRDIGTAVFPNAELKLFMTAEVEMRAQRRHQELNAKGIEISLSEVKENLMQRDYDDTHRQENPLRKAEDALVLDNTHMTQTEQLEWVISKINAQFN